MFYAHIVLAKKGPLARIWLAAHWDKKLTKAHVFETNIEQSVEGIMQPKVKLALRTSGHLLLGVVRIYSRKAKYLLADCNEAFVKIKMAFRPGIVDLPEGHREAAVNAITLPEVFHDFDTALPELNDVDIEAQFSINQSRADEITMREDYGSLSMSIHDDGFGDMGFEADTADLVRAGIDANIDEQLFAEELGKELDQTKEPIAGTSRDLLGEDLTHLEGDGFGDEFQAVGLFEGDIFGEPPALPPEPAPPLPEHDDSDDELDHFDGGVPSPMDSSIGRKSLASPRPPSELDNIAELGAEPAIRPLGARIDTLEESEEQHPEDRTVIDQSTLIQNEEESFALAPVDATAYRGVTKAKRKRKLIVDEVKNISGEEMKSQLANTSDIVTTLDLAPPTKRLMYWKETGGVEKLFALPSRDIRARFLFASYQKHLVSRSSPVEDFSMLGPADVLAIDQLQEQESPTAPILPSRRGRKRKLPLPELIPTPPTDITHMSEIEQIRAAESLVEQRISLPEPMGTTLPPSEISLDAGQLPSTTVESMPPPPTPGFDSLRSPVHYPLPELVGLEPITPGLPSIPMTPGGMELHDDFRHPGIENIDSIPELPADQVSSILNAAEGGEPLDYGDRFGAELAHDWADYDFPPSVGAPQQGDEQMENETDEQFEERVLNKRAAQMFVAVRNRLQKKDTLWLSEMTFRNNRKQAAQKFYSLLVLKKFRALEIEQEGPYADISVIRGPMFDNPKL